MAVEAISTPDAPKAVGPYSQGVKAGGFLFISGQIPLDPQGNLITGDIEAQTRQVIKNLLAIAAAAGAGAEDFVRTTIYLTDLGNFARVNEVYGGYFREKLPARVTVEVSALPKGADVEIDAVVAL